MGKILIAICLAFLISGCAVIDTAAEKVADGVEKYCVQPFEFRNIYANTVNAKLVTVGHAVHVHCSGDPSPVVPTITR